MDDEEVGKGEKHSVLGPGSGGASFCGVVLNMALRRRNPGKCLRGGQRGIGSWPLAFRMGTFGG